MPTYLVTQATGQQSRRVIKYLLKGGNKVHALVRDPQKIPSELQQDGITIFKGNSDNYDEVFAAAQGTVGVFLNTFMLPGLELMQARTVTEAAKKAGLESVVLSTTIYTGDRSKWDNETTKEAGLFEYFTSKSQTEDAVRDAGLKHYTIVRPAFIHFDYLLPSVAYNFPTFHSDRVLEHSFDDGARMPHTDAEDIGRYVAAALQEPAKFDKAEIELGNESLTIEEARDTITKVSGVEVGLRKRTPEEVQALFATFFAQRFHLWANVTDFSSALQAAKDAQSKFGIPLTALQEAFEREKGRLLEALKA